MPEQSHTARITIGQCKNCKTVHRATLVMRRVDARGTMEVGEDGTEYLVDSAGETRAHCACGRWPRLLTIRAKITETPCDARCTHATRAHCECACGGKNHGIAA